MTISFNYSSYLLSNNRLIDRVGTYRKGDGANKGERVVRVSTR